MAQHRIAVKAAKRRKFTDKMWKLFKEKLWEGWTPQMVVGRCRRDGIPMVRVETLYKEYYRRPDHGRGVRQILPECLRKGCGEPRARIPKRNGVGLRLLLGGGRGAREAHPVMAPIVLDIDNRCMI